MLEHLITGELAGSTYAVETTPGIDFRWVPAAELAAAGQMGLCGLPEDRAAANAWKAADQVLVVDIPAEGTADNALEPRPQRLLRSDLGLPARGAHTLIRVPKNCRAVLLFESRGKANLVENLEISLAAGAELTFVTFQNWEDGTVHLASHFVRQGEGSKLRHVNITFGGDLVRLNPSFHLAEQQAEIDSLGLYFAQSYQHLEHQVYVNHDAPDTISNVSYRGALSGAGARSVWIGDVLIGSAATGADSYEQNRNLVLSEGARADSVPNLEIKTGDIAGAGHASATTRFDEEHLFYLQARGISEEEALRLVVYGFLVENIQKARVPEFEEELLAALLLKLEHAEAARAAELGVGAYR